MIFDGALYNKAAALVRVLEMDILNQDDQT